MPEYRCHLSNKYEDIVNLQGEETSDVVLAARVLVSRRLEDKNESLGLDLGSRSLGLEHLVLVLVLKKKSCSFSRLLL